MDFNDLQNVNVLTTEKQMIQRALMFLDGGGRIIDMTIGAPEDTTSGMPLMPASTGARVSTRYITYPPQMVDAIKAAIETRLHEIEAELTKLGVTGVETARVAPAAAMQSPAGRRPPRGG